jgi:hypothetical protein
MVSAIRAPVLRSKSVGIWARKEPASNGNPHRRSCVAKRHLSRSQRLKFEDLGMC